MDLQETYGEDAIEEYYTNIDHAIDGEVKIKDRIIKRIKCKLQSKDKLGDFAAITGINRDNYMIKPGVYAVGNPTSYSPMLVSCNYKYTFDKLREEIEGMNLWLLILDTNGVNVWCAAGKGTFGTKELVNRINKERIREIICHNNLIIPQLGASGISVDKLKRATGFNGIFGPIRSSDIKEFICNDFKASEEMRTIAFPLPERIALTPLNFVQNLHFYLMILALFILINLINNDLRFNSGIIKLGIMNSIPFFIGLVVAAVIFPIIMPLIPFRSFALKGLCLGIICAIFTVANYGTFYTYGNLWMVISVILILIPMIAYIALNFTGSTPITSFSGAVKETLWTLPISLISSSLGCVILIINVM